jgi:hypothetical protein
MPGARNVDFGAIATAFDATGLKNGKEFGMQGTTV